MKKLFLQGLCALSAVIFLSQCTDSATGDGASPDSSATAATSAGSVADDWKLGVQFWTFNRFPFLTAVAKADSAGIKYIEAYPGQALGGEFKDSFDVNMSAESRTKIKQLLASKGMRVIAFGVAGAKDEAGWDKLFAFAKDMGIEYINSEPNKAHWDIIDSLSAVYGVKLAIHEHAKPNLYWHPDSVVAAMKGHANIYACADLGHWGRSGLDVVDCLKKLEGRIIGVHLKDIKGFNDEKDNDVVVGTGVLPWPAIFTELKRQNFKGMLSIERENNWDNNMPDVKQTAAFYNEQTKALK